MRQMKMARICGPPSWGFESAIMTEVLIVFLFLAWVVISGVLSGLKKPDQGREFAFPVNKSRRHSAFQSRFSTVLVQSRL
jgi:hypothetical protein